MECNILYVLILDLIAIKNLSIVLLKLSTVFLFILLSFNVEKYSYIIFHQFYFILIYIFS